MGNVSKKEHNDARSNVEMHIMNHEYNYDDVCVCVYLFIYSSIFVNCLEKKKEGHT